MTKANFTKIRNDMYWSILDPQDGFIRWSGYDDGYWWDNVSKSDRACARIGEITGRIFIIDFNSGDVTISPALESIR